jgi:hypothetical protein
MHTWLETCDEFQGALFSNSSRIGIPLSFSNEHLELNWRGLNSGEFNDQNSNIVEHARSALHYSAPD